MKTLKCRYIPTIKCDTVGKYEFDDPRRYEAMSSEQFQSFFGKPKPNIEGAGVVAAGVATSVITSPITPTPRMIYAKAIYGIEYADFTEAKFNTEAKIDLGINDKSKLIPEDERKANFELFKENNFAKYDIDKAFEFPNVPQYEGPQEGTDAYDAIKSYSLTDYGSLMTKRILNENNLGYNFQVRIEDTLAANADVNFLFLPAGFPLIKVYPIGGQKIISTATIHHEFEHTKYGSASNLKGSLDDERVAVIKFENPARIIHDAEPRYVYYQDEKASLTGVAQTINIITGKVYAGKWTYDKTDPREMVEIK